MSLQERVDSIEKRMLFGVQPILTEMLDLVLGRENFIKKQILTIHLRCMFVDH